MLCKVFESVPGTLVINEPDPPMNLCHLQKEGKLNDTQYDALLTSIIRILSKSHEGINRVCIKPRAQCTVIMKDMTRLQPHIRQIFM